MKVLIVSDTHMENDVFLEITRRWQDKVDLMIHCGDSSLPIDDPLLDGYLVVKGNHDDEPFPEVIIHNNIFLTHGQLYDVFFDYTDLIEDVKKNHCKICLHGHTHVPCHLIIDGIHVINPGCVMINRGPYCYGTYAIMDYNDDMLVVHYYHHTKHYICDDVVIPEGLKTLEEFKELLIKYYKNQK